MRIGHFGLTVDDLARAEEFYSDILGFKAFFKVRRTAEADPWLAAQVGYVSAEIEFCHMRNAHGDHLELLKYWNPQTRFHLDDDTYRPGSVHINFWVEDAVEMVKRIRHFMSIREYGPLCRFAGKADDLDATMITSGPQTGGKGFYMRDPDGHTIEIWQPAKTAEAQGFGKESIPAELERIISSIQAARAANNDSWCDLIRMAYKYAPVDQVKALFRRIEAKDAEILELARSSADAI